MSLALFSFFSQFLHIDSSATIKSAETLYGVSRPAAFAEFVIFDYLSQNRFQTAWKYEKAANLLQKLLQRDAKSLEMTCALVCLH